MNSSLLPLCFAYVLIDAVIDLEWTRKRFADAPDDFFIKPEAIADEIWHVVQQDRSAWSFNVEVRPFRETRVFRSSLGRS